VGGDEQQADELSPCAAFRVQATLQLGESLRALMAVLPSGANAIASLKAVRDFSFSPITARPGGKVLDSCWSLFVRENEPAKASFNCARLVAPAAGAKAHAYRASLLA